MSIFRLTRVPNLIIIALTQYVTAIFLVNQTSKWLEVLTDFRFLLLVISTTMIAGAGYIINDYYDTKIDYVNRPKEVVVGRLIDRRWVLLAHTALNLTAIGIGYFILPIIALIHFSSALLLWLHSNQLKRLPLVGNFIIGLLSGLSLLLVGIFYNSMGILVLAYAFFAFIINIIREIVKDLEAQKGEERFGSQALPSLLGVRQTKILIYALITGAALALTAFLLHSDNKVAIYYFLILIPIFAYFVYLLVRADSRKKFAFLSNFANLIMLSGIISICLF